MKSVMKSIRVGSSGLLMLAIAGGLGQGVANAQQRVRVILTGLKANNQTWDNALNSDGKCDEVYFHADVKVVDRSGNTLLAAQRVSDVMGDTNGFPYRVQAGSCSSRGGMRSGDGFPTDKPWEIHSVVLPQQPPMLLVETDLQKGQNGIAITPAIFEWDGGADLFNEWGRLLVNNGPAIVRSVVSLINGQSPAGQTSQADFIKNNLDTGLPPLFSLLQGIFGASGDRPIGMVGEGNGYTFRSQTLMLTYETAMLLAKTNFGFGDGVISLNYKDDSRLQGDYTLYLKVEPLGSPNQSNRISGVSLRSALGQYVVAEGGGGSVVNANRNSIGLWERFTVIDLNGGVLQSGDYVNIQAQNGQYVVAEGGGGSVVNADRATAHEWERFQIMKLNGDGEIRNGDTVALQSYNGKFVVAEGGGGSAVNANRNAIGPWERFTIIY